MTINHTFSWQRLVLFIVLAAPLTTIGQDTGVARLIAPGAKLVMIADSFKFTEGPTADKQGNIFFTDQPNDRIWKYGNDGKLTLFMENTRRSNGMYFDRKGNLLSCADEQNQLISISKNKKITVLFDNYHDKKLNGPNDLWPDKKGGIYFTDPLYRRAYWKGDVTRVAGEKVYYLPAGSKDAVIVDETIKKPNGIVGSADGKQLYIADIGDNKTYRYDVAADGSLTNRTLFTNMGSDGITIDNQGNLYLTGRGVTIFDKTGKKLGNIPVPAGWTANLCFGGKKNNRLFITASEFLYVLDMNVKGVQ